MAQPPERPEPGVTARRPDTVSVAWDSPASEPTVRPDAVPATPPLAVLGSVPDVHLWAELIRRGLVHPWPGVEGRSDGELLAEATRRTLIRFSSV